MSVPTSDLRRLFVVGCPRSGTTLVQSLLVAHPELCGFTESHFFDQGFRLRPILGASIHPAGLQQWLTRFIEENELQCASQALELTNQIESTGSVASMTASLLSLLDSEARARLKKGWIDKTPDHVRRIPIIRESCPDARFVHVLRSPINTLISLYKAKGQWRNQTSWLRCYLHWYASLRATLTFATSAQNHRIVEFETLTAEPKRISAELIAWLQLPPEPDLLERRIEVAGDLIRDDEQWKAASRMPIRPLPDRDPEEIPIHIRTLLNLSGVYQKIKRTKQDLFVR